MKIGILGGSFDPPHFGHLLVARQTKEFLGIDEVWLMPYFAHSWDTTVSRVEDRFAMTKLIQESGVLASEEEINQAGKSYSIDTVRRLKKRYTHEFYWIVGSDVLSEFHRWRDHEQLVKEVRMLVFPRNGYPLPHSLPSGFAAIISPDLVTSNISSTIVRNRIKKSLSVVGLIPEKVLQYIRDHQLYT